MINFSFSEKLVQLKDIIVSSPFFFISLIVGIILLFIMIIGIKKNRRINRIVFVIAWIFVFIFCVVRYGSFFISIFDRLFARVVEEIYFPSLTVYTLMLVCTNVIFVISIVKKKMTSIFKIVNLSLAMVLDFLFILILDTIMKNNIDVYASLDSYTNPKLLVLLEFSMILFAVWLLLLGIIYLIKKYAVKKIMVSTIKEEEYEVIDIMAGNDDLSTNDEVIEFIENLDEKKDEKLKEEDLEIVDI